MFHFLDCKEVNPVEQHTEQVGISTHSIKFTIPEDNIADLTAAIKREQLLDVKDINRFELVN